MNFGGTLRFNKPACLTLALLIFLMILWISRRPRTSFRMMVLNSDETVQVNVKTLLKAAIVAAERGGKRVMEGTNHDLNIKSKGKTEEGANDPVTNVDYASHCVIYFSLKNTFPSIYITSEESALDSPTCQNQSLIDLEVTPPEHGEIDYLNDEHVFAKDVIIWIDPLDATQEYTEGLYEYVTTMVCVAINGVPILGVIHYPFHPRTYWGWVSKKTSANIKFVGHASDIKQHPRVVVSRSHPGRGAELARDAFGPATAVTKAAGAGVKVMGVVNGTFDVYLHATAIKKWDICAGNAIINAVNGKLTTAKGDTIDYSPGPEFKVPDGILATRFDHNYYLSKISKIMASAP